MGKGHLIIIGGKEDREDEQAILKEVVRLLDKNGTLLLITSATQEPEEAAAEYRKVFRKLGVENMDWLNIQKRDNGFDQENINKVRNASVVFFTGGDQLRITSQMGDTPAYQTLHECFRKGLHIAGTSAGAAVLPETMLVSGSGDESNHMHTLGMAPGLGLIDGVVIDSHFAERGRIGRLLGAVAQNPSNIGVGIDENTALIVNRSGEARVIGDGAVYFVDGTNLSYSSLSEKDTEGVLTVCHVQMHVLAAGKKFDLKEREPILDFEEEAEESA